MDLARPLAGREYYSTKSEKDAAENLDSEQFDTENAPAIRIVPDALDGGSAFVEASTAVLRCTRFRAAYVRTAVHG